MGAVGEGGILLFCFVRQIPAERVASALKCA